MAEIKINDHVRLLKDWTLESPDVFGEEYPRAGAIGIVKGTTEVDGLLRVVFYGFSGVWPGYAENFEVVELHVASEPAANAKDDEPLKAAMCIDCGKKPMSPFAGLCYDCLRDKYDRDKQRPFLDKPAVMKGMPFDTVNSSGEAYCVVWVQDENITRLFVDAAFVERKHAEIERLTAENKALKKEGCAMVAALFRISIIDPETEYGNFPEWDFDEKAKQAFFQAQAIATLILKNIEQKGNEDGTSH